MISVQKESGSNITVKKCFFFRLEAAQGTDMTCYRQLIADEKLFRLEKI